MPSVRQVGTTSVSELRSSRLYCCCRSTIQSTIQCCIVAADLQNKLKYKVVLLPFRLAAVTVWLLLRFSCSYHLAAVTVWLLLPFGCCYRLAAVTVWLLLPFECCYRLAVTVFRLPFGCYLLAVTVWLLPFASYLWLLPLAVTV